MKPPSSRPSPPPPEPVRALTREELARTLMIDHEHAVAADQKAFAEFKLAAEKSQLTRRHLLHLREKLTAFMTEGAPPGERS